MPDLSAFVGDGRIGSSQEGLDNVAVHVNGQKREKQSCQTHRNGIETVDEQSVELRFVIPCQCAQVFELYAGVIG